MKDLPAVIEEKSKLVAKYRQEGSMVFVQEEDLNTQSLFLPEIVLVKGTQDDFHNIQGNWMPKGYQVDKIGEASGICFIAEICGVRKESANVYIGFAQGKKRLPDGTWRTSQVHEYEFDVDVRAEEDFLNDSSKDKPKYTTEKAKRKHFLELKKFARPRAGTGARLKVIRELTGMPISFKMNQIKNAFVFSRIAVNSDKLLETPEMRQAALQQAIGAREAVFGPKQTDEPKALPVNTETAENGEVVEESDLTPEDVKGAEEAFEGIATEDPFAETEDQKMIKDLRNYEKGFREKGDTKKADYLKTYLQEKHTTEELKDLLVRVKEKAEGGAS
nr:hypothetical protein 11 [bacterium]